MHENKQEILDLLVRAVRKTYAGADIEEMIYYEDTEEVIVVYNHGYRKSVNVALDSGIAMIRDVLKQIH